MIKKLTVCILFVIIGFIISHDKALKRENINWNFCK